MRHYPLSLKNILGDRKIAITGLGAYSAAGVGADLLWEAAAAGQSGAAVVGDGRIGCEAPAPDTLLGDFKKARRLDRSVKMALIAAREAILQAGANQIPGGRRALFVGTSRGPEERRADVSAALAAGQRLLPSLAPNCSITSLTGALGQEFGFRGAGVAVSASCASGAQAIALGAEHLALGKADLVLVGASDAALHPAVVAQMDAAGVLAAPGDDDPSSACRPFDAQRGGMVLGEGAGFLVLEWADGAKARGAEALAELAGWSTAMGDGGRTAIDDEALGLDRVMAEAIQLADIEAQEIAYLNAHGTGTPMNDAAEARAYSRLAKAAGANFLLSSTKPITGHPLGAAPALEAIIAIQSLRAGIAPPQANLTKVDAEAASLNIPTKPQPFEQGGVVMSNSLGFWGQLGSLVFRGI